MREISIRVSPFEFVSYESMNVFQRAGKHASASVKGLIKNSDCEECLEMLRNEQWVQIKMIHENHEDTILFYGILTSYQIEHRGGEVLLSLELMSGSCLMDKKKHLRIYQNKKNTYYNLFHKANEEYVRNGVISSIETKTSLNRIYVQHNETDWEFACRMAAQLNTFLVPDIHTGGVKYHVGMPIREIHPMLEHIDYIIKKDKHQHQIYTFKCRELYKMGEGFQISDIPMFIYQIKSTYVNGELIHEYCMMNRKDLQTKSYMNESLSGSSLLGEITSVEKDLVQLNIKDDELKEGVKTWFSYSTVYSSPDGTGWYCMPEPGDEVRLHFPNDDESQAYVISAVHLDAQGGRNQPDHKSFKNKYGREILFTPDGIVITDHSGSRIELSEDIGIVVETDKTIKLNANEKILISSKEGQLNLVASDLVKLRQDDTMIKLDDDIMFSGGEFRIQ